MLTHQQTTSHPIMPARCGGGGLRRDGRGKLAGGTPFAKMAAGAPVPDLPPNPVGRTQPPPTCVRCMCAHAALPLQRNTRHAPPTTLVWIFSLVADACPKRAEVLERVAETGRQPRACAAQQPREGPATPLGVQASPPLPHMHYGRRREHASAELRGRREDAEGERIRRCARVQASRSCDPQANSRAERR